MACVRRTISCRSNGTWRPSWPPASRQSARARLTKASRVSLIGSAPRTRPRGAAPTVPIEVHDDMATDQASMRTPDGRSERYAFVVLALLCFVYVLNFLDRQLLSILAKPIQIGRHTSELQSLMRISYAVFC